MEASYPVDRVTRFAGTNKRSVYMEPSYSALICSIQCSYMTYLNLAANTHALLAKVPPGFTSFRASVYMVKYSSRLGEIPPLSTGVTRLPRQCKHLRHVNISPGNL